MTEKLFYRDSHLAEFEAAVVSCRPLEQGEGKKDRVSPHGGSDRKFMRLSLTVLPSFRKAAGSMRIPACSEKRGCWMSGSQMGGSSIIQTLLWRQEPG